MRRPRSRVLVPLAATLIAVLGAEIALQVASYVASRRAESVSAVARPGGVLCVGDSFTFGSGATSPERSYPRQLARLLAAHDGTAPDVVNAGWPGRSSAEVLAALPHLLEQYSPRTVVVLVGLNDRWSDAGGRAGGETGWQWRWRTRRLLAIAAQALRDRGHADADARGAPAGAGSAPGGSSPDVHPALAAIERDLEVAARAPAAREALAPFADTLRVTADAALAAEIVRILAKAGLRAEAAEGGLAARARCGPSAALSREVAAVLARLDRGDEAIRCAEEAVRLAPDDPRNWRTLTLTARLAQDIGIVMHALAQGYALDRDAAYVLRQLRRQRLAESLPAPLVERLLQGLRVDASTRAEFAALVAAARNPAAFEGSLRVNLDRIARLARDSGALVILLTYPHAGTPDPVDLVITEAAEAADVPLLDLLPVFTAAERQWSRQELYVADGHCTDRGYGIVAAEVERALR